MKFSFGICLSPDYCPGALATIINSIENQKYPYDYEILTIGSEKTSLIEHPKLRHIEFDETIKESWITRKKNILAQEAKGDWLTIMHDYYILEPGWTEALWNKHIVYDDSQYSKEGIDPTFHALCGPIQNVNGTRHSDWLINERWMDYLYEANPGLLERVRDYAPHENHPRWVCGLPYKENLTKFQYISGGFISAWRKVFLDVPFDDRLTWGQEEDLRWSEDFASAGYRMEFVKNMKVKLLKPNKWELTEIPPFALIKLKEIYNEHND